MNHTYEKKTSNAPRTISILAPYLVSPFTENIITKSKVNRFKENKRFAFLFEFIGLVQVFTSACVRALVGLSFKIRDLSWIQNTTPPNDSKFYG